MQDHERNLTSPERSKSGFRVGYGLPPSVNSKRESGKVAKLFTPDSDLSYRVTYSVTVTLSHGGRPLVFEKHEILHYPNPAPQPPIFTNDFPGEYVLEASTQLISQARRGLSTETLIGVNSVEPETLLIDRDSNEASTQLSLTLRVLLDAAGAAYAASAWIPSQCKLRCRLRETTIVTQAYIGQAVPTLVQARTSGNAELERKNGAWQSYDVAIQNWDGPLQVSPSTSVQRVAECCVNYLFEADRFTADTTGKVQSVFATTLSVPFRIRGSELPCPTFFTSLLSRRYAVEMEVSFPDAVRSTTRLVLPLQIAG